MIVYHKSIAHDTLLTGKRRVLFYAQRPKQSYFLDAASRICYNYFKVAIDENMGKKVERNPFLATRQYTIFYNKGKT